MRVLIDGLAVIGALWLLGLAALAVLVLGLSRTPAEYTPGHLRDALGDEDGEDW